MMQSDTKKKEYLLVSTDRIKIKLSFVVNIKKQNHKGKNHLALLFFFNNSL